MLADVGKIWWSPVDNNQYRNYKLNEGNAETKGFTKGEE